MEMKIYTKTGDDGTTGLADGTRVSKGEARLEAYGTVDELNAWMGMLACAAVDPDIKSLLMSIQEKLFVIGSRLAAGERELPATGKLLLGDEAIAELEKAIDAFTALLPPLRHFILPGGDPEACRCHVARTVCRRAERRIVALASGKPADPSVVKYINRLSDFLFVYSRKINHDRGIIETRWMSRD